MKIRFLSHTYIRRSRNQPEQAPLGVVFAGTEMEVEDRLYRGTELNGSSTYFRDDRGWYYWSGRVHILHRELAPAEPITVPPTREETPPVSAGTPQASSPPREIKGGAEAGTTLDLTTAVPRWYSPLDPFHKTYWQNAQLTGKGVKIGIISDRSFRTADQYPNQIKKRDFGGKGITPINGASGPDQLINTLLARTDTAMGICPEAELRLSVVSQPGGREFPSAFANAVEWLASESVDVVLLDLFADESSVSFASLEASLQKVVVRGGLLIAPVGEGRGHRPVNRWPAGNSSVIGVGAYHRSGTPLGSNQRSPSIDLLGPGESPPYVAATTSPSRMAAVYLAGVAALAREYAKQNHLSLSGPQWRANILESTIPLPGVSAASGGRGRFDGHRLMELLRAFPAQGRASSLRF